LSSAAGLLLTLLSAGGRNEENDLPAARAAGLEERRSADAVPGPLAVYFKDADAWNAPVLEAVPAFARVGQTIFGEHLPLVRMFMISNADDFARFTLATVGEARAQGTGTRHLVVMCLKCVKRPAGAKETTAVVLHEAGHAWMNTFLKEAYGVDYLTRAIHRPFLDEGIADWIASRWDSEYLSRRRQWLAGKRLPPLEDLTDTASFNSDRNLHYWLSALLVARMLGPGPEGPPKVRAFLELLGKTRSPEASWEEATGKSIRKEYDALLAELR
jgi:hypothetical protein